MAACIFGLTKKATGSALPAKCAALDLGQVAHVQRRGIVGRDVEAVQDFAIYRSDAEKVDETVRPGAVLQSLFERGVRIEP